MMRTIFYPAEKHMIPERHFVTTVGFFDGVHRGHRFLIEHLKEVANKKGYLSMVITFENHPRQVLHSDWQPLLLTTLTERINLLEQTGIDMLVVLRFDEVMASLSAYKFMKQILQDDLHVAILLTGYDNRFGHDRTEDFNDYVKYGQKLNIEVIQGRAFDVGEKHVSSSLVRRLLNDGNVSEAAHCLSRPYQLTGRVIHGEQIGRQLGFPTANLQITDNYRLIPKTGVYAVEVNVEGDNSKYIGMMNIGTRPTFEGYEQTLEVNILDFNSNIYGLQLNIFFLKRLRSEMRFSSAIELVRQMEHDEEQTRTIAYNHYK